MSTAFPVVAQSALNGQVVDADGRRYIDFASGIGVTTVGHCHPKVVAAVQEQLRRFTHTAFQVLAYDGYVNLAEALNCITPCEGEKRAVLFNTGAEAVENAVKIARAATGRTKVIAFSGGFHGRSFMALALTGKATPYKSGFGPLPADVHRLPFPAEGTRDAQECLHAFEKFFHSEAEPSQVAAVVIEPVQGEGGFNVACPGALRGIRALCDRHGILLIVDEVQSGFGRTGRMFAIEHSGVAPDLVAMAKGLGGGLPIAAVVGREPVMNSVAPGGLGGTFAGNPLSCAAALAVLDIFREENLLEAARTVGAIITASLAELGGRFGRYYRVRGLGSMVAMEIIDPATGDANAALARHLQEVAFSRGLLLLTCGQGANVLRFLPPLTIARQELLKGMALLSDSLSSILARFESHN